MRRAVLIGLVLLVCAGVAGCTNQYYAGIVMVEPPSLDLSYEDEWISVTFMEEIGKSINFQLINESDVTARIVWDEAAFVDVTGEVSRVTHTDVKYADAERTQPPTTIPAGAMAADCIFPTKNISYEYSSWRVQSIVTTTNIDAYVGKRISILLPIMFGETKREYRFVFKIVKFRQMSLTDVTMN